MKEFQTKITTWGEKRGPQKTYSQDWPNYNLAQTSEKLMFLDILEELCGYVPMDEKPPTRGRPRLSLKEMLFCMGLLVYGGKSSRRTISELHLAKDRKQISHVPNFNTILKYFDNEYIEHYLQRILTLSSLPLKVIEQDFAADSSGFTTSVFGRWMNFRGQRRKDHRLWVKAHVMVGVKTNIITSLEITTAKIGDSTMFKPLVEKTSHNFEMKEVSADKAYSSRANLQFVSDMGAIPFIPFRSNVTGKARGCQIWKAMYVHYTQHKEEFAQHYHKRSNVETVFSQIKRKFGMNLRTKKEQCQKNEVLLKCLCHNIVTLIHETFESGINTDLAKWIKEMNYYARTHPAQKIKS